MKERRKEESEGDGEVRLDLVVKPAYTNAEERREGQHLLLCQTQQHQYHANDNQISTK